MSFMKSTIIGWRDGAGEYRNTSRRGHWTPAACKAAVLRACPLASDIRASHHSNDMSGRGWGGVDRRFTGDGAAIPLLGSDLEGDGDDMNELYDTLGQ